MKIPVQTLIRAAAVADGLCALVGLWAVIHLETDSAKDQMMKGFLLAFVLAVIALCVAVAGEWLTITF